MRRVSVVGGSGSGKTTTGRAIADRMGVSFVEIDALHWTHPGWELPPLEEFRASVDAATRGDAWVVDGSYGK
ncbi:MAG: AAA family ATPase, partial [Chloroflexi bacterium]